MPKQQATCYHFIITPPSSVLSNTSTSNLRCSPICTHTTSCSNTHTLTQFNNTYTRHRHWGYTPTNVTFNGHSLKHMHTYNTLLHREPCWVLSGRTQMAATWCVLMGSCNGIGQDVDTHRWRPTESWREMDVLSIDLLRSMICNLVIWHWGSCTDWADTLALYIWHKYIKTVFSQTATSVNIFSIS